MRKGEAKIGRRVQGPVVGWHVVRGDGQLFRSHNRTGVWVFPNVHKNPVLGVAHGQVSLGVFGLHAATRPWGTIWHAQWGQDAGLGYLLCKVELSGVVYKAGTLLCASRRRVLGTVSLAPILATALTLVCKRDVSGLTPRQAIMQARHWTEDSRFRATLTKLANKALR